jgi:hypothetical protein
MMPTADRYRAAASTFRTFGEHYLRHAALVSRWPVAGHLGSGPVAAEVTDALGRSAANLTDASAAMAALAAVCDRRAEICDDYRRRVREYEQLDPGRRRLVPRPAPPFPWTA